MPHPSKIKTPSMTVRNWQSIGNSRREIDNYIHNRTKEAIFLKYILIYHTKIELYANKLSCKEIVVKNCLNLIIRILKLNQFKNPQAGRIRN